MSMSIEDLVNELRQAVLADDEWPMPGTKVRVTAAARRLIRAIDHRSEVVAQMRATVTPTQQAIAEIMGLNQ